MFDQNRPAEWKHLLPFGYAPGGYMIHCVGCQQHYSWADKRAVRCPTCAQIAYNDHQIIMDNFDLFAYAERASKVCGNTKKDQSDILSALFEEGGELSVEVQIGNGKKDREPGKDGVVGEAIDVIVVALDMIHSELGHLNPEVLKPIFRRKLDKWMEKYGRTV